jgi:predicted lipoprotein with Yx(FWY)xxD motif
MNAAATLHGLHARTAIFATASGGAIITRDDGSLQCACRGRPLHAGIKDMKPGDRSGDGFDKAWSLARP